MTKEENWRIEQVDITAGRPLGSAKNEEVDMERKLRIGDPDAVNVPFIFAVGDCVRLKSDHSISGTIKDGCFKGEYPSGPYAIRYEMEIQDSQMFSADQIELEKITKD